MAGFKLAAVSALVTVVSSMAAPRITVTASQTLPYPDQASDESTFLQGMSRTAFRSTPQKKYVELTATAAQCSAGGVDCEQEGEIESLLQMPTKKSVKGKRRRASTQEAIYAALEKNTHVSAALQSAVQQEDAAAQEAADGKYRRGSAEGVHSNHNFLRYALEENKRAEQALQSAVQVEEEKDLVLAAAPATKGKRRRSTSQEAIYAALEQNHHLTHALESAVQQEEAAIQEAARGHRVGAEHGGQTNHGFIQYALQLDEQVNTALLSARQGLEEEEAASLATAPQTNRPQSKRRKSTAQEAIYKAMDEFHQKATQP